MVQQVRFQLHDDIQRLYGTMPLWGLDRWVSLGDIFVDVNILELTSSNRRSELDDLWQDFTRNNSNYRSLDRIGLGNQQQRISGLAVLERDTNLMVVGKPGSGKTTYLQRIVTECNEGKLKEYRIPVLIKLREFVDDGRKYAYNLEQFLEHQWRLSNADVELILKQGLALILLDGLDEVEGEARKQITKEIKRFARSYPQIKIIVTCRTQSQESKFDRFDYVEVADFNEKQVEAFAEHWFGTVCTNAEEGKTKAKEFLSQLFQEENKPIRELAITPILLSLTCAVFQQTGKFYSKRSKLYEEGLELLLEQWDKSREVTRDEIYRDLSLERKLELLSYIAVKKFEQEQYVLFEQAELEGYIGEFLGIERQESRSVLKAIESQHGLLIERAREIWSFSHLTFQEYLVAISLAKDDKWHPYIKYVAQNKYIEIFLIIAGILENADNFIVLMKFQIDKSTALDKQIQKFLNTIYKISMVDSSVFQPASFRAFHLMTCGKSSFFHTIQGDTELDTNHTIYDLKILKNDPLRLPDYRLVTISACETGLTDLVVGHKNKDNDYDNKSYLLLKSLKKLRQRLPSYNQESNSFSDFIKNDYERWLEELNRIITEHYNFNRRWNFSKTQKKILRDYYNANRLLLDCLYRSSNLNPEIKEAIKDALFLPIAEIEKRKQSNS